MIDFLWIDEEGDETFDTSHFDEYAALEKEKGRKQKTNTDVQGATALPGHLGWRRLQGNGSYESMPAFWICRLI